MYHAPTIYIILNLINNVQPFCQKPGETKYFVPNGTGSFFEAVKGCFDKWGSLANIDSKEKLSDMRTQLIDAVASDGLYWTSGISYWTAEESHWTCYSNGEDVPNNVWCPGQPDEKVGSNSYKEACQAVMLKRDESNLCAHDYTCYTVLKYICEITYT